MIRASEKYIWLYLFLAFSGAGFALIPAGFMIQKLAIVCLAFLIILSQGFKLKLARGLTPYAVILTILVAFTLLSSYSYSGSVVFSFIVVQKFIFLLFCLFGASHVYLILQKNDLKSFNVVVIGLVFSQFFFVLIKFLILGEIAEGFLIGSMHHNAGELGFLFPAIFIPVVLLRFFHNNIYFSLILLLMLVMFSILNEKRAIFYLGPLIIGFSLFSLRKDKVSASSIIKSTIMILGSGLVLGFFVSKISSLSGLENAVSNSGGQLGYLIDYSISYLTMDYDSALQASAAEAVVNTNVQLGRAILWVKGLELFYNMDLYHQVFGLGFGYITPSEYINSPDVIFEKLGFRGAISGALQVLIEGGLFGLCLFSVLLLMPLHHLRKKLKKSRNFGDIRSTHLVRILIIIQLIFIFDFYFYSQVLFVTSPLPLLFFLNLCFVYMPIKKEYKY